MFLVLSSSHDNAKSGDRYLTLLFLLVYSCVLEVDQFDGGSNFDWIEVYLSDNTRWNNDSSVWILNLALLMDLFCRVSSLENHNFICWENSSMNLDPLLL